MLGQLTTDVYKRRGYHAHDQRIEKGIVSVISLTQPLEEGRPVQQWYQAMHLTYVSLMPLDAPILIP